MTMRTVNEWLARTFRDHPGHPALRVGGAQVRYAELDAASALAAARIRAAADRPRRVGVLASRTIGTYAGYAGALRAGAAAIPLNRDFPPARNESVARVADLDVLVCAAQDAAVGAALGAATGLAVVVLPEDDRLREDAAAVDERTGLAAVAPDDTAYILFTSGSTGTPKGVPIKHSCVSAYMAHNIPYFSAGPGARISQTSDLTFDLSGFSLFVAWGSGATLVVPGRTELLDPAEHVRRERITHWLSVPSVVALAGQLGNLPPGGMPGLRWSLFVGEALTAEHARVWREAAPNAAVENLYGPTEVTVSCTSYRLADDPAEWPEVNGTVPIGRPYPGTEVAVAAEDGSEADEGELLLRGVQRFDGYLDPSLNPGRFAERAADRFVPYAGDGELTPAHWYRTGDRVRRVHGELFHLGRLDNQVKVRGYRIEPGDIEAALRAHPAIDQAVVVPHRYGDEVELAAAYTGGPVAREELEALVADRLPAYMIPEFFVWMPSLPLTVNGKIDRVSLTAGSADWATG